MEKPSDPVADAGGKCAHPAPSEAIRSGGRSHASVVPSSGVEDVDMVALRTYIQELQAENED